MPDDERTRRRLGDETKGRIADLASGWSIDGDAAPAPEPAKPANAPRRKAKTLPPPPPGSAARKALEEAIVDAVETPVPAAASTSGAATSTAPSAPVERAASPQPIAAPRTKPPTAPPPARTKPPTAPPPARAKQPTMPPPPPPTATRPKTTTGAFGAKSGPTETGTVARSGLIAVKPATGAKSGPTDTGTVSRSGLIEPKTGAPVKPASTTGAVAAIATSSQTGSHRALPPPRTPLKPNGSGPVAALATPATAPVRSEPAPGAISRLPLRADPTDVSAPPVVPAPPSLPAMTPVSAIKRPISEDVSETIPEDQPGAMPKLAVPLGEFDTQGTNIEQEKLRIAYEQATLKRDAANALLGLPEMPETVVRSPPVEVLLHETAHQLLRGDPTAGSVETTRFERGDPTNGDLGDPTVIGAVPTGGAGGKLRDAATLRRKRGVVGDLRYVATVFAGVRRSRRELTELEHRQELRRDSRRRHLITLGRVAATFEGLDHPALGPARERLAAVEEERSMHSGAVAAADIELQRVRRERDTKAKQCITELGAVDGELADIAKKLEPLDKEIQAITKRAASLREQLQQIDRKIKETEASRHSVKTDKTDRAGIEAELATLRADRKSVERDEPRLAAELDEIQPRAAALEARRAELRKQRVDLEQAEADDRRRSEDLLAAIGAKRKVVERAARDAEGMRDKILFELGERLYVDHPADLAAQLAPIDTIDVELGTGERRLMELREILSSVDKAKLARGIGLVVLIVVALAGIATLTVLAAVS
ncbi:MAG TPA: hypothetical protein VFQ53_06330 [Kofleriaceae bacterium]|nr:hypothetical protein [Kofleriaceae bacterium]